MIPHADSNMMVTPGSLEHGEIRNEPGQKDDEGWEGGPEPRPAAPAPEAEPPVEDEAPE